MQVCYEFVMVHQNLEILALLRRVDMREARQECKKFKIAHEEGNSSPNFSSFVGAIIGKVTPMGNVCSDINILRKV